MIQSERKTKLKDAGKMEEGRTYGWMDGWQKVEVRNNFWLKAKNSLKYRKKNPYEIVNTELL